MTGSAAGLPFVQLEFTHALGPSPGRYVVSSEGDAAAREPGTSEVLVIDAVPAPAVRRRGRHHDGDAAASSAVTLAVVTHIKTRLARDERMGGAAEWVQASAADPALQRAWTDEAIALVNQAVRAHRVSCGDPYFPEVTSTDPRVVRIGYGSPAAVVAGAWEHAYLVTPARAPRLGHAERNAAPEVVAAALGGRPVLLDADELILRGLLDLDQGRSRLAALELEAAARSLLAELDGVAASAELDARRAALPGVLARLQGHPPGAHSDRADRDLDTALHAAASELRRTSDAYRTDVLARYSRR